MFSGKNGVLVWGVFLACGFLQDLDGDTLSFSGAGDGVSWTDPLNWFPEGTAVEDARVPNQDDTAVIPDVQQVECRPVEKLQVGAIQLNGNISLFQGDFLEVMGAVTISGGVAVIEVGGRLAVFGALNIEDRGKLILEEDSVVQVHSGILNGAEDLAETEAAIVMELGAVFEVAFGGTFLVASTSNGVLGQATASLGVSSRIQVTDGELIFEEGKEFAIPSLLLRENGTLRVGEVLEVTQDLVCEGGAVRGLDGDALPGRLIARRGLTLDGTAESEFQLERIVVENHWISSSWRGGSIVGLSGAEFIHHEGAIFEIFAEEGLLTASGLSISNSGEIRKKGEADLLFDRVSYDGGAGRLRVESGGVQVEGGLIRGDVDIVDGAQVSVGGEFGVDHCSLSGADFSGAGQVFIQGGIDVDEDSSIRTSVRIGPRPGIPIPENATVIGGAGVLAFYDQVVWEDGIYSGEGQLFVALQSRVEIFSATFEGVPDVMTILNFGELRFGSSDREWEVFSGDIDDSLKDSWIANEGLITIANEGTWHDANGSLLELENTSDGRLHVDLPDPAGFVELRAILNNQGEFRIEHGTVHIADYRQSRVGFTRLENGSEVGAFEDGSISFNQGSIEGNGRLSIQSANGAGGASFSFVKTRFKPGLSPGLLAFERFYMDDRSTLSIDIGGAELGEFDRIAVDFDAVFGEEPEEGKPEDDFGKLEVRLLGSYSPVLGDTFRFLTAKSITRKFRELNLPNLGPDKEFQVVFGSDGTTAFAELKVVSTVLIPGEMTIQMLGPEFAHPGDSVTFELVYHNATGELAEGVVIQNFLPFGAVFDNATHGGVLDGFGQVVWTIGDVVDQSGGNVFFTVIVDDHFTGSLDNSLYSLSDSSNNIAYGDPLSTDIFRGEFAFSVNRIEDHAPGSNNNGLLNSGESGAVIWIDASNTGPVDLENIAITSELGPEINGVTLVSDSFVLLDLSSGESQQDISLFSLNVEPVWPPGDSIPVRLKVSFLENGTAHEVTVILNVATNILSENTFAGFVDQFGIFGEDASPTAKPWDNGLSNLMAYALGVNPRQFSQNRLPSLQLVESLEGAFLALEFERDPLKRDLNYKVFASDGFIENRCILESIGGADPVLKDGAVLLKDDGAVTRTVRVRDGVSSLQSEKRFLFLQVELAP